MSAAGHPVSHVAGVWRLAWADGVLTDAEDHDLRILASLLAVPLEMEPSAQTTPTLAVPPTPPATRAEELVGMSVCFTGASVCTMRGHLLERSDQERLAADAGMEIKQGVSGRLDILVLADPDSRSGKARKARDLGVRMMAEPSFWRSLGVPID